MEASFERRLYRYPDDGAATLCWSASPDSTVYGVVVTQVEPPAGVIGAIGELAGPGCVSIELSADMSGPLTVEVAATTEFGQQVSASASTTVADTRTE